MARIAFLVHNYFEQVELTETQEILQEHGHDTTLVSADTLHVQGMREDVHKEDTFTADALLKDIDPLHFDALVIPGGTVNADQLRVNPLAQALVRNFLQRDRLVAAICHAPWLLISAGVVEGKNITAYKTVKDDLINAGATYLDEAVVQDGDIITSRKPADIPAFAQAIDEFFIKHDSR